MKEEDVLFEILEGLKNGELHVEKGYDFETVKEHAEQLKQALENRKTFLKREINETTRELLQNNDKILYVDENGKLNAVYPEEIPNAIVVRSKPAQWINFLEIKGTTYYKIADLKPQHPAIFGREIDNVYIQIPDLQKTILAIVHKRSTLSTHRSISVESNMFIRCKTDNDLIEASTILAKMKEAKHTINRMVDELYTKPTYEESHWIVRGHLIRAKKEYEPRTRHILIIDGKEYIITEKIYYSLRYAIDRKEYLTKAIKHILKKTKKIDETDQETLINTTRTLIPIATGEPPSMQIKEVPIVYQSTTKTQRILLNDVEILRAKSGAFQTFKRITKLLGKWTARPQNEVIEIIAHEIAKETGNKEEAKNKIMIALV